MKVPKHIHQILTKLLYSKYKMSNVAAKILIFSCSQKCNHKMAECEKRLWDSLCYAILWLGNLHMVAKPCFLI